MMKQRVALFLALTLPLIGADDSWDQVKAVQHGEKIWISYMEGEKLRTSQGAMRVLFEDSLAVRLGKNDVVMAREDVRKVSVYGGKNRGKGAGYGFLAGAAGGAVVGIAAGASDTGSSDGLIVGVVAALGALIGGLIGAVVGSAVGTTKRVVIYDATATAPVE